MMQPALRADRLHLRSNRWLQAIVSKPGVGIARAEADLGSDRTGPGSRRIAEDAGSEITLFELWQAPSMGGIAVTAVMGVQLGVAGVVLLIACANVANLPAGKRGARASAETAVRLTRSAPAAAVSCSRCSRRAVCLPSPAACRAAVRALTRDLARVVHPAGAAADRHQPGSSNVDGHAVSRRASPLSTALLFGWSRRCRARRVVDHRLEGVGDRGHRDAEARVCARRWWWLRSRCRCVLLVSAGLLLSAR